jgi:hypothetical protein
MQARHSPAALAQHQLIIILAMLYVCPSMVHAALRKLKDPIQSPVQLKAYMEFGVDYSDPIIAKAHIRWQRSV